MGADCGCGGTCNICGPVLARNIMHHSYEISRVAQRAGLIPKKADEKKPEDQQKEEKNKT